MAVAGPEGCGAVVGRGEGDLEVEDSVAEYLEAGGVTGQAGAEVVFWVEDRTAAVFKQMSEKRVGFIRGGRPA